MYLYGIESEIIAEKEAARQRLNCTFMELKVKYGGVLIPRDFGLNCTFMELKGVFIDLAAGLAVLALIVPLWN